MQTHNQASTGGFWLSHLDKGTQLQRLRKDLYLVIGRFPVVSTGEIMIPQISMISLPVMHRCCPQPTTIGNKRPKWSCGSQWRTLRTMTKECVKLWPCFAVVRHSAESRGWISTAGEQHDSQDPSAIPNGREKREKATSNGAMYSRILFSPAKPSRVDFLWGCGGVQQRRVEASCMPKWITLSVHFSLMLSVYRQSGLSWNKNGI